MPDIVTTIARMIITLLAVIVAGISVMIFVRLPVLKALRRPIDNNLVLADGNRLFGDHKTWKGFLGYIVFTSLWTAILGLLAASYPRWEAMNYLYVYQDNTPLYNLLIGAALGLAYALFELPNSFLKRRLAIKPGQTADNALRYLLIFLDQADSVIGCVMVLALVYPMTIGFFLAYVLLGACIHIFLNLLLSLAGLRKEKR